MLLIVACQLRFVSWWQVFFQPVVAAPGGLLPGGVMAGFAFKKVWLPGLFICFGPLMINSV